jgi:hypothetical protein
MTRRQIIATAVLCVLGGLACREGLPTAPSDLETGIIIYEHADYLGEAAHITTNVSDLKDFEGPCIEPDGDGGGTDVWNDCVSSIRVAPGWYAHVYEHDDFDGDYIEVAADVPNLRFAGPGCSNGFNDCITSIRVFAP